MRLIDADKVDKIVKPWSEEMDCNAITIADARKLILNTISRMPTVDAMKVVHGNWIKHDYAEESEGLLIPNYECSVCHSWLRDDRDYCGDCGSKMDERKDGEQDAQ